MPTLPDQIMWLQITNGWLNLLAKLVRKISLGVFFEEALSGPKKIGLVWWDSFRRLAMFSMRGWALPAHWPSRRDDAGGWESGGECSFSLQSIDRHYIGQILYNIFSSFSMAFLGKVSHFHLQMIIALYLWLTTYSEKLKSYAFNNLIDYTITPSQKGILPEWRLS